MRLWLPHDPAVALDGAAVRELVNDHRAAVQAPPREGAGVAARFRFVYELPPAASLPAPPLELPRTPRLPALVMLWGYALEGVLWLDSDQLTSVHARREWGNVAGLEVTL